MKRKGKKELHETDNKKIKTLDIPKVKFINIVDASCHEIRQAQRQKFGLMIVLYCTCMFCPNHTHNLQSVLLQQKNYRSLHKTLKSSALFERLTGSQF